MKKPPYRVPGMTEIEAIPHNGYHVVSTFSGAGGSCLGYRMAGYKVLWASEFIPAAQEVYQLNHPNSILDTRDIRDVQPADILDAIGLSVGEIDILDGSPPCASFSIAGNRDRDWGKVKKYSDSNQRVDDLFDEYIRILRGLKPKVFIAENVKGLILGRSKGYFKRILKKLKASGYQVTARVLNAKWLGVPQNRERLIFVGVREDIKKQPVYPEPFTYTYTVADAIPERQINGIHYKIPDGKMSELYWAVQKDYHNGRWEDTHVRLYGKKGFMNHRTCSWDLPSYCILQGSMGIYHPDEPRTMSIPELKRLQSLPDDFQLVGSLKQQWERIGRMVPPLMMKSVAKTIQLEVLD